MIVQLTGTLVSKSAPTLVVDVAGVGYEVQASLSTFDQLPAVGEQFSLLTHFVVREDAQLLFGFASERERMTFRSLVKISGVGPKLALAILSGMDVDILSQAIRQGDIASLTRLPGVGKKTAERLVIEMKDRIAEWGAAEDSGVATTGNAVDSSSGIVSEAEKALVALG